MYLSLWLNSLLLYQNAHVTTLSMYLDLTHLNQVCHLAFLEESSGNAESLNCEHKL